MPRLTILFGIILILLGVLTYAYVGSRFPTSLIPAGIGIILAICGSLARTTDLKRRGLCMHIAATVGLLGFLATIQGFVQWILMLGGRQYPYPIALEEKTATCVLLLVFVVLCVRSFIAARRARLA